MEKTFPEDEAQGLPYLWKCVKIIAQKTEHIKQPSGSYRKETTEKEVIGLDVGLMSTFTALSSSL